MRFNLKTSKLIYEVRYQYFDESYTFEQLYKDINGKYFLHFEGGKYNKLLAERQNFNIDEENIELWKKVSKSIKENNFDRYEVIDWEKEEKEYLVWMGQISEEDLPF